jgi:tetratricopeptide (TPR) repeat protein
MIHPGLVAFAIFITSAAVFAAEPLDLAPKAPPAAAAPQPQKPRQSEAEAYGEAVDKLLGQLATTTEPAAAKRVAAAVLALWSRSGSDTVDLLTARAGEAQRKAKLDVAVKLMDEAIALKPDFAEGWNRRATLHFAAKDYDEAMADLHETLLREPRHYGAWVGLGRILRESDLDRQALAAFRRALEIYPAIEGLKRETEELALKVEGQPI